MSRRSFWMGRAALVGFLFLLVTTGGYFCQSRREAPLKHSIVVQSDTWAPKLAFTAAWCGRKEWPSGLTGDSGSGEHGLPGTSSGLAATSSVAPSFGFKMSLSLYAASVWVVGPVGTQPVLTVLLR
jgi:hypothetical protein